MKVKYFWAVICKEWCGWFCKESNNGDICGSNKMSNRFFHFKRINLSENTRIYDYPYTKQNQKINNKRDLNGSMKIKQSSRLL